MSTDPSGDWILDPTLPVFAPERRDRSMAYSGLRCRCGCDSFRISGWPRAAEGRGGQFWRTLARVWREARQPVQDSEARESPFWLPLCLECEACDRRARLFEARSLIGRMDPEAEDNPREAYRCRVCRRSSVALVVGMVGLEAVNPEADDALLRGAAEVIARCQSCRRQARVAWCDARPSSQEIRLDLLYGRR